MRLAFFILIAVPVFAQLDPQTISIAATRSIVLQPDQVVFDITVSSPLNATLDQVVAALSPLAVTSADLSGVGNSAGQLLQWNFTYAVPLSNLTATTASISAVQQRMTIRSMLSLSFTVAGTQVSQQLQQSQTCSDADLISDATAQAQTLAAAANLTLGPILKVSNVPAETAAVAQLFVPVTAVPVLSGVPLPSVSQPVTCSMLVEFQLSNPTQSSVRKP